MDDKEKYISSVLEKTKIYSGRRKYKGKYFTHFVWDLYHPDDPVKKGEVIHHKNEDILDDRIDNLEKLKIGDHVSFHNSGFNHPLFGRRHTEKTKEKMSQALTGSNHYMYGKTHSKETKEKLSRSKSGPNHPMFGKTPSQKTKEKLSKAKAGSNNPMYGKRRSHSKETKRKISEAMKGKRHSEETKRKMSISALHRKGVVR